MLRETSWSLFEIASLISYIRVINLVLDWDVQCAHLLVHWNTSLSVLLSESLLLLQDLFPDVDLM